MFKQMILCFVALFTALTLTSGTVDAGETVRAGQIPRDALLAWNIKSPDGIASNKSFKLIQVNEDEWVSGPNRYIELSRTRYEIILQLEGVPGPCNLTKITSKGEVFIHNGLPDANGNPYFNAPFLGRLRIR